MSNHALDIHNVASLKVQEVQVYDTFTLTLIRVTQQGDSHGEHDFVLRLFGPLEGIAIVNEPETRHISMEARREPS
mgnify:CR=1 FL=1|tara:strand:+ start:71 stop:298 length:228 start_codon:yes stop_codon:yes gene_type:complete